MMNTRIKYPRTPHLPWSPGASNDDLRCMSTERFHGSEVVVTEKMDGENTTIYPDHCHARSIDSRHHLSRDWVKGFQARIAHEIPVGWRICGENLYARHSIAYKNLASYFYGFSIWNHDNVCLNWSDTLTWFEMLGIATPKLLYRGIWDEKLIRELSVDAHAMEGYVVRLAQSFHYEEFATVVAKWVRRGHVQTEQHWMFAEVIPNQLNDELGGK